MFLIDKKGGAVQLLLETYKSGGQAKITCGEGEELINVIETKEKKSITWEVEFK